MRIINDDVRVFLNGLFPHGNRLLEELRKKGEEDDVPIIMRDSERFINGVFNIRKPEAVLEIGTAIGYSACSVALNCNCNVVTVEADRDMHLSALENIQKLKLHDKIRAVYGRAEDVLPRLEDEGLCFGGVFIDGAKSHYKTFWDLSLPLCADGSVIICDNVLMRGMTVSPTSAERKKYKTSIRRMREFLDHICNVNYVETDVVPVGDGLSVSRVTGDVRKTESTGDNEKY